MKCKNGLFVWGALVCLVMPLLANAIDVSEPANVRIAEGVELSAYVIGNRWDMSDATDIINIEPGYLSNETFSNGIYSATTIEVGGKTDPKFFLTYPGLPSAVSSMG